MFLSLRLANINRTSSIKKKTNGKSIKPLNTYFISVKHISEKIFKSKIKIK